MTTWRRALGVVAANPNAAVFLVGLVALVAGVGLRWGWSLASLTGGVVLMVVAVYPYVAQPKGLLR